MQNAQPASCATILKRFRLASVLTQEGLAERAGISTDTVRALERGRHGAPHADTLAQLAAALGLSPEDRAALIGAAMPEQPPHAAPSARADRSRPQTSR